MFNVQRCSMLKDVQCSKMFYVQRRSMFNVGCGMRDDLMFVWIFGCSTMFGLLNIRCEKDSMCDVGRLFVCSMCNVQCAMCNVRDEMS